MLYGVDVSGHQSTWKPSGEEEFVGVKITEGRTYVSEHRLHQVPDSHRAGAIVLHYHFLWPGNATEQAAYFVSQLFDLQPGDLLVCDWEETKGGFPTVGDAANFIAEVKRLKPDYKVGLYTFKDAWLHTTVKKGDFLWLAYYTTQADPGVTGWDFWQYSRSDNLDKNHARFDTVEEMRAWSTPGERPPVGTFWSEKWQSYYLEFGGSAKWMTPLDKTILKACALAVGWGSVRIVQGGLRPHTDFSGWTHHGLGVGDVGIDGRPKFMVWDYCAALRRSGMRPFPRGYGGDPWENEKHVHNASRESYAAGHPDLQSQIREQEAGGDGLQGSGKYNGPTYAKLDRWAGSPYNPVNFRTDTGKYRVISDTLNGRTVDDAIFRTRSKGYIVQAAQEVTRFGRHNIVTATPTYYAKEHLEPV